MKNIINLKNILLPVLLAAGLVSCKKENNGEVAAEKGAPTITRVRTVSRTIKDTVTYTYTTYTSTGTTTSTTSTDVNHQTITPLDSTTATGNLGQYYAIEGSHLASTTKILINGIQIYFNKADASDNMLIFNIPSTIPYVQPQPNTIQLFNLYGSVTYNFTTLPPPPTIISVSDFNFSAGSTLTLTGRGFASVTGITLTKGGPTVSITKQNDSLLVLKMPTTTLTRGNLYFTYTSGAKTQNTLSGQEFIDMDNNYVVFGNGNFQNSWGDASWSGPSGANASAPSISGKGSAVATYPAGAWQIEGWANWYPSMNYDPAYKYLTFWVKGGTADHTLVLVGDQMKGGYNQVQNANAYAAQLIKVPAKVWTYFKIPLTPNQASTNVNQLNFWANGNVAKQLGFFLQGQSGDVNETYYFDEVMFVK